MHLKMAFIRSVALVTEAFRKSYPDFLFNLTENRYSLSKTLFDSVLFDKRAEENLLKPQI